MLLKHVRKIRAEFLGILEAAIFFQGFLRVNSWFFKTSFADIFRNMHFCSVIQNIQSKKQPAGSVGGIFGNCLW